MKPINAAQARIHEAAVRLFAERGAVQVSISDLAQAAGVARGTIYNNLPQPDSLFEDVASRLGTEMHERVNLSFGAIQDPAQRLANGLRLFIRRAHDEPHWGRFILRFALTNASLQSMWNGPPTRDLVTGMESGRYAFRAEQMASVLSLVATAGLSGIFLVMEGHRTWRDAGSDAAELVLRAIGIPAEEARLLAAADLPPLPELPG